MDWFILFLIGYGGAALPPLDFQSVKVTEHR